MGPASGWWEDEARAWRRANGLVRYKSPRTRSSGEGLAGSRWGLCGEIVFEAVARPGHRRGKPFAQGRLPLRLAVEIERTWASSPRVYCEMGGKNKISLAKRAAHKKGWQTISYTCRGARVTRQVKTFLATSRLTSGLIRVVIIRFDDGGWAPYFCTDSTAEVQDVLEAVAASWAIEEPLFHVKAA